MAFGEENTEVVQDDLELLAMLQYSNKPHQLFRQRKGLDKAKLAHHFKMITNWDMFVIFQLAVNAGTTPERLKATKWFANALPKVGVKLRINIEELCMQLSDVNTNKKSA